MKTRLTLALGAVLASIAGAAPLELTPSREDAALIRRAAVRSAVEMLEAIVQQQRWILKDVRVGTVVAVDAVEMPQDKRNHIFNDPVINLQRKVSVQITWPAAAAGTEIWDIERRGEIVDGYADALNDRPGNLLVTPDPCYPGQTLMWQRPPLLAGDGNERPPLPRRDAQGRLQVQVLPAAWGACMAEAAQVVPQMLQQDAAKLPAYARHPNALVRMVAFAQTVRRALSGGRLPEPWPDGADEVEVAVGTAFMLNRKSSGCNTWLMEQVELATEPGLLNGLALGAYAALAYMDAEGLQLLRQRAFLSRPNADGPGPGLQQCPAFALLTFCAARETRHFKRLHITTDLPFYLHALRLAGLLLPKGDSH